MNIQRKFSLFFKGLQENKLKISLSVFTLIYLFSFNVAPILAANTTFTYDANGNMLSDGTNCYAYNEANELKQVTNCSNNQLIAQYLYDGDGNRIVKKIYTNGVLSQTVYSPVKTYETIKFANNTTQNSTYYFANNQIIAKKNPDGTKIFYQNDHLGSTALLTNASGSAVENTTYDPWGQVLTGGAQSKYQYTGQQKDQETPLNYYNARYYDPQIQHFTQPDDIYPNMYNPQTLNRYAYTQNNPLRYTDPSGHCIEDFCIMESILLGTFIMANINYFVAIGHQMVSSIQQNHSFTNIAANIIDFASNFVGGKAKETVTKAVGEQVVSHSSQIATAAKAVASTTESAFRGTNTTQRLGTIYTAFDESGAVQYVGKAVNFTRREMQHLSSTGFKIVPAFENVPEKDLRPLEQATIEQFGLNNLANHINSVSPNNPIYKDINAIAAPYFKSIGW